MFENMTAHFTYDCDNRDYNISKAMLLKKYYHENMLSSQKRYIHLQISSHDDLIKLLNDNGFTVSLELSDKFFIIGYDDKDSGGKLREDIFVLEFNDFNRIKNDMVYDGINIHASPSIIKRIDKLLEKSRAPKINSYYSFHFINYYVNSENHLDYFGLHVNKDSNHIIDNFYPYMHVDKLIDTFYESDESILILTGIPGTGKTSFVKRLMFGFYDRNKSKFNLDSDSHYNMQCHYIKDPAVMFFEDYWQTFLKNEPAMLILDDFDNELAPRAKDADNTLVNKLLSISNGIFEHNSKIIITTNKSDCEIDEALLRPGRCFDILQLRPLRRDEAKNIWINHYNNSEESFDSCREFKELLTITQSHLASENDKYKMSKDVGYLAENDISIRRKYINGLKTNFGFNG